MLDMFKNNIVKEKYSFVFFASYERGGEVAMNAYKKMQYPNKRMYFTSPDTDELNRKDITSDIIPIRWSDKKSTFQLLSKMEYFIYPLALPSRRGYQFHKDTDGLVVAESLLHEVIVITYPVGALKEKYGDHLIYLPFPPNVDTHILEGPDQISVPEFHSEFVLESIIKTVEFLENNPNLKEIIKKRGKEFILNKKEPTQIGNEWLKNLHLI
jgi:glycosyltransferase involved in cell wall biosynthesis